jgi:hypothetical protein
MTTKDDGTLRDFDTGATRDTAEGKLDYEGFLSPFVLRQYARFMNMNRLQSDGQLRDSSNWQKGIPMNVYMKSLQRHFMETWYSYRMAKNYKLTMPREQMIEYVSAICGMMFNTMGYLHELLKKNPEIRFDDDEPTKEMKERQLNVEKAKEFAEKTEHLFETYDEQERINEAVAGRAKQRFDEAHQMEDDSSLAPINPDAAMRCGNCKWADVNDDQEPCKSCLLKMMQTEGTAYALWMRRKDD